MNEGVGAVAWSQDESYAYMLAYGRPPGPTWIEFLVIMKDPLKQAAWSTVDGEPDVFILDRLTTKKVITNSLFAHPTLNYQTIHVQPFKITKAQIYPARVNIVQNVLAPDLAYVNLDAALHSDYLYVLAYKVPASNAL